MYLSGVLRSYPYLDIDFGHSDAMRTPLPVHLVSRCLRVCCRTLAQRPNSHKQIVRSLGFQGFVCLCECVNEQLLTTAQVKYWKRRANHWKGVVNSLRHAADCATYVAKPRAQRAQAARRRYQKFSLKGGYTVAFKRSCGHAGLEALKQHLDISQSRQSVARWELLLAASLQVQCRLWHSAHYSLAPYCGLDSRCAR